MSHQAEEYHPPPPKKKQGVIINKLDQFKYDS